MCLWRHGDRDLRSERAPLVDSPDMSRNKHKQDDQLGLFDERIPECETPQDTVRRPKIDLHRHLLGSLSVETVVELIDKHGLERPADSRTGLENLLTIRRRVDGLKPFFSPWPVLSRLLTSPEVVADAVLHALRDAAKDNISYCELRVAWGMTGREPFGVEEFLSSASKGLAQAKRETGVEGRLILGITRHLFARHAFELRRRLWKSILDAASRWQHSVVVGFDVSGIEDGYPAVLYKQELLMAREAGFHITIHSGETGNAYELWQVVIDLAPERIGHGLAAIKDPALLKHLAQHQIAVESCPTVNWLTRTVPELEHHPLKDMQSAGVPVTIATDNPAICGTSLSRELALAQEMLRLSAATIQLMHRTAAKHMFVKGEIQQRMLRTVSQGNSQDKQGP